LIADSLETNFSLRDFMATTRRSSSRLPVNFWKPAKILSIIKSQDTKWVKGATVKFDGRTWGPLQTDEAGRALFSIVKGDTVQGFISAPGFETTRFSVGCSEPQSQEKVAHLPD
jgi:hypothetical protein